MLDRIKALFDYIGVRISGAFAATYQFDPLTNVDSSPLLTRILGSGDFMSFVQNAFKAAIAFGAIAAVLRLAWAGFLYMTSSIANTKARAKEVIRDSLIGLFLLLGMVIILQQINPDLLDLTISNL